VDALKVKVPPSLPVDKKYIAAYDSLKVKMVAELDSILINDNPI
jgi:hypothetical protein